MASIQQALVASVAVGGGHHAFDDAKVIVEHLGDRGQAVGGAASVADDVVLVVVVFIVVHANDKGAIFVLTRSGNQHFLCPCVQVLGCPFLADEHAGRLNDQIHIPGFPGQIFGVAIGGALDGVTIDGDRVVICLNVSPESAQHCVVLQQVSVGSGVRGVVDSDHLKLAIFSACPAAHKVPADASKSVNCDSNHCVLPSVYINELPG